MQDASPFPYSDAALADVAGRLLADDLERVEKLDHFRHALGELQQRWDNAFVPERENLVEAYRQGRFKIVLQGYVLGSGIKRRWLLSAEFAPFETEMQTALGSKHQLSEDRPGRRHDQLVVLVDPVDSMKPIEVMVAALVRLHFIEDKVFRAGESGLYRVDTPPGGYVFWPILGERKQTVGIRQCLHVDGFDGLGIDVVQRRFEVVEGIADDERQAVWDWVFGLKNDGGRPPKLTVKPYRVEVSNVDGGQFGIEFVNVAIGPLNL